MIRDGTALGGLTLAWKISIKVYLLNNVQPQFEDKCTGIQQLSYAAYNYVRGNLVRKTSKTERVKIFI